MATTYSDSIAKLGRHVFGDAATYAIRKIELSDLGEALRLGWEDFARENPDLLTWRPSVLDRYYTAETLGSELARQVFVLPDR